MPPTRDARHCCRQPAEHGHEFVATQAGERVARPQYATHAVGNHLQHEIAGDVPVIVIDRLEAVEVDIGHRDPSGLAARLHQRALQAVRQQLPVGRPVRASWLACQRRASSARFWSTRSA